MGWFAFAFTGGAMDSAHFRADVEHRLAAATPLAHIVAPAFEPAVGAALLACDAAGLVRPPI